MCLKWPGLSHNASADISNHIVGGNLLIVSYKYQVTLMFLNDIYLISISCNGFGNHSIMRIPSAQSKQNNCEEGRYYTTIESKTIQTPFSTV